MSDVRTYRRDRASIAEAVIARVGGNRAEVAAIVDDIGGDFIGSLHGVVTGLLYQALGPAFGGTFDDRVEVDGDLDVLRSLADRTTLILAPTHASNLDSLVLGTVAARAGLPPFAYASGKHIYRNRVFGQLIRRLGGYKLDPDRRDRLYMRVVNIYVHELLSRGYHSVIFPSGTRGRSGEVEAKLKLGLLGAAVHVPGPVTIVPVAINYQVVLEADHLIAYYLAGRSHERIVGDEMFKWGRLGMNARRFRTLDQRVAIQFGDPIDPHALGGTWRSQLVEQITAAYRRGTVFFATHVVARALSDIDRDHDRIDRTYIDDDHSDHDRSDRDRSDRNRSDHELVDRKDLERAIAETRARLDANPESGQTWSGLTRMSDREVLDAAIGAWRSWHANPPAASRDDGIAITNRDLLLYYRNRTAHIA